MIFKLGTIMRYLSCEEINSRRFYGSMQGWRYIMGKGFYNIYLCFHHKSYGCFILHHQVLLEKKTVEGCVCGMLDYNTESQTVDNSG